MLRRLRKRIEPAPSLIVLSFPKSGRTWHRMMLGHYLTQILGWPEDRALDLEALCDEIGIGRIVYTHNGANFNDGTPSKARSVADHSEWAGLPVLHITRDPRDVLVSAYHHAVYRERIFEGSISEFIRRDDTGADKLFTALNRWKANEHRASRFEALSYESMHEDPFGALVITIKMLGAMIDAEYVERSVTFATFDKMKEYELTDRFQNVRLSPADDDRGNKVRAGKVGGFLDVLDADDLAWIDERAALHSLSAVDA